MTDEEKKAIELLKQEPDFSLNYYNRENAIDVVLNLIEKQSKEIEELYQDNLTLIQEINQRWLDKIKAKIEEEDKLFFKTKDVRHANRYKAYKELLEKE